MYRDIYSYKICFRNSKKPTHNTIFATGKKFRLMYWWISVLCKYLLLIFASCDVFEDFFFCKLATLRKALVSKQITWWLKVCLFWVGKKNSLLKFEIKFLEKLLRILSWIKLLKKKRFLKKVISCVKRKLSGFTETFLWSNSTKEVGRDFDFVWVYLISLSTVQWSVSRPFYITYCQLFMTLFKTTLLKRTLRSSHPVSQH